MAITLLTTSNRNEQLKDLTKKLKAGDISIDKNSKLDNEENNVVDFRR